MAKEYRVVLYNELGNPVYSKYFSPRYARKIEDAEKEFAKKKLGIYGGNLKRFMEDNSGKKLLRAMPYSHDHTKMKAIFRIKYLTAELGNNLPGWVSKYQEQDVIFETPAYKQIYKIPTKKIVEPEEDFYEWVETPKVIKDYKAGDLCMLLSMAYEEMENFNTLLWVLAKEK